MNMVYPQIPRTPAFVISERVLKKNLQKIQWLREHSGAKVVLALKCFSAWGIFPIIAPFLDGSTTSSPYEVRLGKTHFGGETHAYSVAYDEQDIRDVDPLADKIIFNSLTQLERFRSQLTHCRSIGLRINPATSHASHTLADPARQFSRLGVVREHVSVEQLNGVEGLMFHMQCENLDVQDFRRILSHISTTFADLLAHVNWVSLGGGVLFTHEQFDLPTFANTLKAFSEQHAVQVYLEPGEAVVTKSGELLASVLDLVNNERTTAILDASSEAHRLDTLLYNEPTTLANHTPDGTFHYFLGGNSCLAGDIFGEARLTTPLNIGDRVRLIDSAGYTLVKQNWFNGLRMPDVYLERENGECVLINRCDYDDFERASARYSI